MHFNRFAVIVLSVSAINTCILLRGLSFQWVSAREKFQQAANLIDAEQRMKKSMWGQFWSAHQRFFKYLCIASKVRRVVQLAREEVQNGKVGLCNMTSPRGEHIAM